MPAIFGLDLAQKGLSLYAVPAGFLLFFAPQMYAVTAAGNNYDLAYPPSLPNNLAKDESLDKPTKNRILRAKAAADNSLETLGYFAAGVAAANAAGVDAGLVNALSFGILGLRTLATATYTVFQENRNTAPLRTVFWLSSQIGTAALFVLAGNTLAIWPN